MAANMSVNYESKLLEKTQAKGGEIRSHDQFMQDQFSHELKRYDKLKTLIVSLDEETTPHHPKISRKSQLITEQMKKRR
jgi:hypothetical protein